jgi:phage terminase large subunit-like protein
MKEEVWEVIISPALSRAEGGALFIGTPEGKNHFYKVWANGLAADPLWKSWSYKSIDNPFIPRAEITAAESRMSAERFRQEMEASFEASGGMVLTSAMFPIVDVVPYPHDMYIAIDLAGFQTSDAGRKIERLDDHAIAIVAAHAGGWCIVDIVHGKWDTRETSLRIVKAFRDHRPRKIGIEKGIAKDAVLPYMEDEMARLKTYFNIEPLTHGNQRKTDRIAWALQGRAEKGRIQLKRGDWNRVFLQQAVDFPSHLSHDDLLDAVAYIDQLADPWMEMAVDTFDNWAPLDEVAGY